MKRSLLAKAFAVAVLALISAATALAAAERGVTVREASMYVSPDLSSAKLQAVERGREVVLLEKSNAWLHVIELLPNEVEHTGWMEAKGIVFPSMPNADQIIFGEAANSETEASRAHGRRGAAEDAMRLYAWLAENMKNSPLAGEALYRAADDQWQLERADRWSRPSAKRNDKGWEADIPEDNIRQVMKKFPNTKWADLAAYDLIDNKRCPDWTTDMSCAEKEANAYEKYASDHPQSPKAAEALYEAAWRESALIQMYRTAEQAKKVEDAKSRTQALASRIVGNYAQQGDWAQRAQALLYYLQQDIPTFGIAGASPNTGSDVQP